MTYAWPFLWMALGAGLLLVFDIVAGSWILRREAKAARQTSRLQFRLVDAHRNASQGNLARISGILDAYTTKPRGATASEITRRAK